MGWRGWLWNSWLDCKLYSHYDDVIIGTIGSQITSLTIVYLTVYSGADQSKHQSPASLAFVWGIHRGPVNSPHKWPVTRKMFPFDDVIMSCHIKLPQRQAITWELIPCLNIKPPYWLHQLSNHGRLVMPYYRRSSEMWNQFLCGPGFNATLSRTAAMHH